MRAGDGSFFAVKNDARVPGFLLLRWAPTARWPMIWQDRGAAKCRRVPEAAKKRQRLGNHRERRKRSLHVFAQAPCASLLAVDGSLAAQKDWPGRGCAVHS